MPDQSPAAVVGCLLDVSGSMREALESGRCEQPADERLHAAIGAALRIAQAERRRDSNSLVFVGMFGLNTNKCPPVVDLCGVIEAIMDGDDTHRTGHDLLIELQVADDKNLSHFTGYIKTKFTNHQACILYKYLRGHKDRIEEFVKATTFLGGCLPANITKAAHVVGGILAGNSAAIDDAVNKSEAMQLADKMCKNWWQEFAKFVPRKVDKVIDLLQRMQEYSDLSGNSGGKELDSNTLSGWLCSHLYGKTPMVKVLSKSLAAFREYSNVQHRVLVLVSDVCSATVLDEFCSLLFSARFGSADALLDIVGRVQLDAYITGEQDRVCKSPSNQDQSGTCYAHALAAVLHMALLRIVGRDGGYPSIKDIRNRILHKFPEWPKEKTVDEVLKVVTDWYGPLRFKKVDEQGARQAVSHRRPVLTTFYLSNKGWEVFTAHFGHDDTRSSVLTRSCIDITASISDEDRHVDDRDDSDEDEDDSDVNVGHAVVLSKCDDRSLTFLNSWGHDWGQQGSFRIEDSTVLDGVEFYDIYWTAADLSETERQAYNTQVDETLCPWAEQYLSILMLEAHCPCCDKSSAIIDFNGSIRRAACPLCH